MKKIVSSVLVVGLLVLVHFQSFGQARLRVTRLDNYPQAPADTAIIGLVYSNIHIHVKNTGNSAFFGDIRTYLYSQSVGSSNYDTLRDDPSHPYIFIGAGDSVSLPANPMYQFRPIHYAAGDNIVVVWPVSGTVLFDTYSIPIFYSVTTGLREPAEPALEIYPNPVSQILRLTYGDRIKVEQVRIYDPFGKEIFQATKAVSTIDLSGMKEGIYFLELIPATGEHVVKKIQVISQ